MSEPGKPNMPDDSGKEPSVPLKILLADDMPMNLQLVVKLLTRRGHIVTAVENGEQAYESYKNNIFDVVLMDMQMPVMDGLEATRMIRKFETHQDQQQGTRSHTPIIAMTANDDENDKEACKKAGMDGFITKPIEIKTVVTTIRQIIDDTKTST
jgi:CheY-like chemotaxis protein